MSGTEIGLGGSPGPRSLQVPLALSVSRFLPRPGRENGPPERERPGPGSPARAERAGGASSEAERDGVGRLTKWPAPEPAEPGSTRRRTQHEARADGALAVHIIPPPGGAH